MPIASNEILQLLVAEIKIPRWFHVSRLKPLGEIPYPSNLKLTRENVTRNGIPRKRKESLKKFFQPLLSLFLNFMNTNSNFFNYGITSR